MGHKIDRLRAALGEAEQTIAELRDTVLDREETIAALLKFCEGLTERTEAAEAREKGARNEAFRECAEMVKAEEKRILALQTVDAAPGTDDEKINQNLRMVVVLFDDLSVSMYAKLKGGK